MIRIVGTPLDQSNRRRLSQHDVEPSHRDSVVARDVDYALEGYAVDMLSDLIFYVEGDLDREIEGERSVSA